MSLVILSTSASKILNRLRELAKISETPGVGHLAGHFPRVKPIIGTAGWTLPKTASEHFPEEGSHLGRYAEVFRGVEINSTFYRPHQPKTFRRWKNETPKSFSFSIKMSKVITHEKRLGVTRKEVAEWLEPVRELDEKLGALLIQLAPSFQFDLKVAKSFFKILRAEAGGMIALEPRHNTWTTKEALALFDDFEITKVEADPERAPLVKMKTELLKPRYLRLHGSPVIYRSSYEKAQIEEWAAQLKKNKSKRPSWVVFDNTMFGHATANALQLQRLLNQDAADVSFSSSRKFKRRKAGDKTNMAPTVAKHKPAPMTAD